MAYCDKCGAYIPDGFSKCFACGYDAEEEAKAAAAAVQKDSSSAFDGGIGGNYYTFSNDELKQKLEQQRERQKEISRKWAEAERERRQAQREREAESYVNRPPQTNYTRSTAETTNRLQENNLKSRILAALSYLSILFVLPCFICPEDQFAKFHAKQGIALFVLSIIAAVSSRIPILGWLIYGGLGVLRVICIIKGISNALSNKTEPLPLIGNLFRF